MPLLKVNLEDLKGQLDKELSSNMSLDWLTLDVSRDRKMIPFWKRITVKSNKWWDLPQTSIYSDLTHVYEITWWDLWSSILSWMHTVDFFSAVITDPVSF